MKHSEVGPVNGLLDNMLEWVIRHALQVTAAQCVDRCWCASSISETLWPRAPLGFLLLSAASASTARHIQKHPVGLCCQRSESAAVQVKWRPWVNRRQQLNTPVKFGGAFGDFSEPHFASTQHRLYCDYQTENSFVALHSTISHWGGSFDFGLFCHQWQT